MAPAFQYADLGLSPTLRDLIQQMIVTSDNTATDIMTTRVGAVEALNAWLAASGYRLRMINRGWDNGGSSSPGSIRGLRRLRPRR